MRSPKDMSIIQIDITNACVHRCSNCTRFCGHHQQNFFMDFDFFKRAVDSLDEYQGIVGIIGGEPTLHPEFERFADYLREKRVKKHPPVLREPVVDMQKFIQDKNFGDSATHKRTGLWCSLNLGYYKHFEVINDTFAEQLLNDHDSECSHQALLMPRKDLGIDDETWLKKRNACWIQNSWSATITPKGAFFCEVAGSLDMLFGGKGGWEVEPGWWKRRPEEFGEQLEWCELCSACLDVPQRISSDERDDITPQMLERLKDLGSPKIRSNMYVVHTPGSEKEMTYHTFTTGSDYIDAASGIRTSRRNRNLYPKNFVITDWEKLENTLLGGEVTDWIVVSDDITTAEQEAKVLTNVILNPGCIYLCGNSAILNVRARSLRGFLADPHKINRDIISLYPLDKIVSVDLTKMQHEEKIEAFLAKIGPGNKVVVYGAGKVGKKVFADLMSRNTCHVCGWVDRNWQELGYPVQAPEAMERMEFDYVLIAVKSPKVYEEVKYLLLTKGVEEKKILWGYPQA